MTSFQCNMQNDISERRQVAVRARRRVHGEGLLNTCRISFWGDEKILELERRGSPKS